MALALVLVFLGVVFVLIRRKIDNEPLISPIVEITPTATPEAAPVASIGAVLGVATPSATPTKKITPKPTIKVTPKITPTPANSQDVNNFIERFSNQYGVDPNVIRHIAICESGFNSSATNGKYIGLFQFDTTTWINLRKVMGEETNPELRYSAEEAVQTVCYAISKGKSRLWPHCIP